MSETLTDFERGVLRVFCDTVVPGIEMPNDPTGLWSRRASDLDADAGVAEAILSLPDPRARAGLREVLQVLALQGILSAPSQLSREQILRNLSLASPDAAAGVAALIGMTLFLTYGAPDPKTGRNPNWDAFGYAGPISSPPPPAKGISPLTPRDGETLEADVCVVGSGPGGGVAAGVLAARGLKVIVIEAGEYYDESDFVQLELKAYQDMYWRGGPTPTADGNVTLQAGATLGGGTTVNWTNCLRTHPWVREQWAREHGLEGVDGPEFDRHLEAVLGRITANARCSDLNGPQQRLREGCERLAYAFKTVVRNIDPERYDPRSAGYLGFGDQSGSKQSTVKTFLRDAIDAGGEIIVRCRAERIILQGGRAAGVEATYQSQDGQGHKVVIRAPRVVVACGALESPALLTRSGLGRPPVGDYLRLHPCTAIFGAYAEQQDAWWGAPQAGLCEEFADTGDGYGFMIETTQYAPAITGSAVPWVSGYQHKEVMERLPYGASFISLTRDRGRGRVVVDNRGEPIALYSIADEVDLRNLRHGLEVQLRLHRAAGALELHALAPGMPSWRWGDDLEAFLARLAAIPFGAGGHRLFSAHQMGTCRMGSDPVTSVAGPWGELHDAGGVFIADASAFPTSSGTNPMVTVMALAHRTAEAIAAGPTSTGATGKRQPVGGVRE